MKKKKTTKQILSKKTTPWPILLITSFLICFGVAGLGSIITTPEINGWYRTIPKFSFSPPDAVFGPVWTILYLLMAISAFLVSLKGCEKPIVRRALAVFGIQLGLNLLWSLTFFGFHNPGNALMVVVVLWLTIIWTMVRFWIVRPLASLLLIPYLLWVTFATFLNYNIYMVLR